MKSSIGEILLSAKYLIALFQLCLFGRFLQELNLKEDFVSIQLIYLTLALIAELECFTKKTFYYGFKVHAIVSDDGYLLDYAITKASVNDARETIELLVNAQPKNRYLLGDEGYVGKDLHHQLKKMGYILWTPYRKNMKNAKKHNNHYLMALRRTIESDFSLLTYYNAENNRARSLTGFQERLEVAILAYNMAYCLERFNQHHALVR